MRRIYKFRLITRCLIFIACGVMYLGRPEALDILEADHFFKSFSPLHLLWALWMADMAGQLIPVKQPVALGSQKLFEFCFAKTEETGHSHRLKDYMAGAARGAGKVLVIWSVLTAVLGFLYFSDRIGDKELFMISVFFYVCDLICVVIWCPFRLLMKTRCCTTCRIFNWDHLMMFSPMAFVRGFYARSLFVMSVLVWTVWEASVFFHPERFWEGTNASLKCKNCGDRLCWRPRPGR